MRFVKDVRAWTLVVSMKLWKSSPLLQPWGNCSWRRKYHESREAWEFNWRWAELFIIKRQTACNLNIQPWTIAKSMSLRAQKAIFQCWGWLHAPRKYSRPVPWFSWSKIRLSIISSSQTKSYALEQYIVNKICELWTLLYPSTRFLINKYSA